MWEFAYCWMRTALLSLRVYRRKRFDVIQACNPPDTYFALARLYKPFGVRFVFDHHDLCPELLLSRDLDTEPPKPLMHALYALERATFATADHVITTNESYRDTARGRTRKAFDDFTVVRSAPDPALDDPRPTRSPSCATAAATCAPTSASWATRTASAWSSRPPT